MGVQLQFNAPQVILTGLIMLSCGVAWARFGERKRDSYDIGDALLGPAISFFLLWWGGFYG